MPVGHREREEHAMIASATVQQTVTTQPRDVVARFVELIAAQDLDGLVSLYAPNALWEVHVPGWDGSASCPADLIDLHHGFFVQNRDAFAVDGYQILADGDSVALRWTLSWRDRQDGAHCVSFQSHFFDIANGQIHRHHMYCAGVRAYDE
jgi:ketosteroid isomerase-like protein